MTFLARGMRRVAAVLGGSSAADHPRPVDVEKIRALYTAPYYLSITTLDDDGIHEFVRIALGAQVDGVLWMLGTEEWRCRRAGAWFALVREESEIQHALEQSLLTSRGSLTAPDLGAVLAQLRDAACLPLLLEYQERGLRDNHHGPQGEIAALIRDLGGTPLTDDDSEGSTARMARMRDTAARILTAAHPDRAV